MCARKCVAVKELISLFGREGEGEQYSPSANTTLYFCIMRASGLRGNEGGPHRDSARRKPPRRGGGADGNLGAQLGHMTVSHLPGCAYATPLVHMSQ